MSGINKSIGPLATLFPNLIDIENMQDLDTEWRECLLDMDFSKYSQESADVFWKEILATKRGDGTLAFPLLSKFVFQIFSLPNSSAAVERTFSSINLNKTKVRNRLNTSTLEAILQSKDYLHKNQNRNCFDVEISETLRKRFNSSIYQNETEVHDLQ